MIMHSKKHWAPGSGVKVLRVVRMGKDGWKVYASIPEKGICPGCGIRSRRRHGWRLRRLQDYPAHGETVTVELRIGRWRCTFQDCSRSTFSDEVSVAAPHARRTARTAQIASHLGHATGGRPAERLMRRLGMPVSDDTILRHLKHNAAGAAPPARIIGLDDWSWRKTWRYGTIVVDLERRSVVDILEDRSVESAAHWLRRNPSVEVVSRDRCGLYAQAVREGAPQAIQIADRFHLVQNLRLAVEEQMSLSGRSTGRSILSEEDNVDAALHRRRARLAHRQSRDEVFATIHSLHSEGLSYCEIERRTGYKRRTVAKWLKFETPPDRRRAALNPRAPWYFEKFLAQCWKDGNRCGRHLFHDVKERGYTGSFSNLERLLGPVGPKLRFWPSEEQKTNVPTSFAPLRRSHGCQPRLSNGGSRRY
ncbi:transposase (plasmid) [Mesorhizobium japonicum MAFF 303099]|uniref:Transposase n=1 Tax=Mesorhizobium japonicum (strain LMG 29417 / CECT 9101 / MAFF 303099) TaxID=266835 RepID=Q982K3_RHILO|nr:transposase [Mesorhizobium japonicum MAFF 303099]